MSTNTFKAYDNLIDNNVDITELYIYDYVINSDASLYLENDEITRMVDKIKNNYVNDLNQNNLSYHIDKVLYSEGEDDEWD